MPMGSIWVGVDVGKTHHHVAAVDDAGKLVLSQQVANDQREIATIVAQLGSRVSASTPGRSPSLLAHTRAWACTIP